MTGLARPGPPLATPLLSYCKGNGIKATETLNFQSLGKFSKVHEKFMKKSSS